MFTKFYYRKRRLLLQMVGEVYPGMGSLFLLLYTI
uniref:Uncharacterized protein n=1 Tax=Picea sitchensis TaxID=3332 RepID=A9NYE9_PICSI|nr:unknown [Picea sitchensis]